MLFLEVYRSLTYVKACHRSIKLVCLLGKDLLEYFQTVNRAESGRIMSGNVNLLEGGHDYII